MTNTTIAVLIIGRGAAVVMLAALAGCKSRDDPPATQGLGLSSTGRSTSAADPPAATRTARNSTATPRMRPTSTPAGTSCSTAGCHGEMLQAAYVHAPLVAANGCTACHGPEQEGHKFPLVREMNDTCTFCHVVFSGKPHKHQVVATGHCTVCHDPHAARNKFLFREALADRCLTCHPQQHKKFDHGPFATGACMACHAPHESDNEHLTIANGAENCFRCHAEVKSRLTAAVSRHAPVEQACTNCHEPHTSNEKYTLKADRQALCLSCHKEIEATVRTASEQHGALLVENGCGNCHDAHGSGQPRLLKDQVATLCLNCHGKAVQAHDGRTIRSVKAEVSQRAFLHGPVRAGQCQVCHQVHGSSNSRLLSAVFPETFYARFDVTNYALCFSCHEQAMVIDKATTNLTGFRNGDQNLHFVHVNRDKGRTCTACHAIHGSDLPKHLATSVPFEGGGWSMPINFAKTATGGSCAPGCHQAYQYDREKPMQYPGAP